MQPDSKAKELKKYGASWRKAEKPVPELELPYAQKSPEAIPSTAASALFPGTGCFAQDFLQMHKMLFPRCFQLELLLLPIKKQQHAFPSQASWLLLLKQLRSASSQAGTACFCGGGEKEPLQRSTKKVDEQTHDLSWDFCFSLKKRRK